MAASGWFRPLRVSALVMTVKRETGQLGVKPTGSRGQLDDALERAETIQETLENTHRRGYRPGRGINPWQGGPGRPRIG